MKRRSFFAMALGGVAVAFGFKRKPENPFSWGSFTLAPGTYRITREGFVRA